MDFADRWGWRSPRPPPRRALQSPDYTRKKAAEQKREKEKRKNLPFLKRKVRALLSKE
jgi:hypothetical protein